MEIKQCFFLPTMTSFTVCWIQAYYLYVSGGVNYPLSPKDLGSRLFVDVHYKYWEIL